MNITELIYTNAIISGLLIIVISITLITAVSYYATVGIFYALQVVSDL